MIGSRRRLMKRAIAALWMMVLAGVGLCAGVQWAPIVVHRALSMLDPLVLEKLVNGATIGAAVVVALLMTGWSWTQLRNGGLDRLISSFRRRD